MAVQLVLVFWTFQYLHLVYTNNRLECYNNNWCSQYHWNKEYVGKRRGQHLLNLSIAAAFLIYNTGKTTITNQMQNDRASMTGNMRTNNITTNNHQCDNSGNIKSMDKATKT
jgi:hypothetical protein